MVTDIRVGEENRSLWVLFSRATSHDHQLHWFARFARGDRHTSSLSEPGNEHKENLETGMMAAAMGGVTAVFEMPNLDPLTTTPEAIQDKLNRAARAT